MRAAAESVCGTAAGGGAACGTTVKCTAAGSGMHRCSARHCAARTASQTGVDAREDGTAASWSDAGNQCMLHMKWAGGAKTFGADTAGWYGCAALTKKWQILSWLKAGSLMDHSTD